MVLWQGASRNVRFKVVGPKEVWGGKPGGREERDCQVVLVAH